MARLAKYLLFLLIILAIALIAYAYIGPWFGADFSAPTQEMRKPVVLDVD